MKSPVLFIIFKRAETTKKVFERIREAQPPRLYIAADGPRKDRADELAKCKATRKLVEDIDWPCEVHRLYRDENLGCGRGVSNGISWFFEHEEQGVIIEDDILPHLDFFIYCDVMLDRFKNDDRIQLISGSNYFYDEFHSGYSYYMSCFMNIWGWASWRRVWNTYQFDVKKLDGKRLYKQLYKQLPKKSAVFFEKIYEDMKSFKTDTWDFQLFLNQQYYGRYSISPFTNMIENIGFGTEDAAHTKSANRTISNHKAKSPMPIIHPHPLEKNKKADIVSMKSSGLYCRSLLDRILGKLSRIVNKLIV